MENSIFGGVLELEPKRVIDLWFEDGNVVIQAEDYQFCLFKSFLTTRSPIFKDTFFIPQPEDAERINGCPVLRIHDSATDAAHFFMAIFNSECVLPRSPIHDSHYRFVEHSCRPPRRPLSRRLRRSSD
jgi:hypothetical protein